MMKKNIRKLVQARLDGFSLMEISIVLLIIGILAGGVLKGRDLIEIAQIRAVVNDFQNLQTAFESYVNSYSALPGDDATASGKFQNVANGDGDGAISENDAKKIFGHLFAAGLIESKEYKVPKIGGKYDIITENNDIKLRLSNNSSPFLNKKQTLAVIAKVNEMFGATGGIVEADPKISSKDNQKYIIKFKIR